MFFGRKQVSGFTLLRPKIHEYTGYKRTGFVKPDSVKLAMGNLCATLDSRSCAPCTVYWVELGC